MTVLVTGGAGYIGSHMVLELGDAGERVVVLDNLSTGFSWAVAEGVPLATGDSGDQDLVARLIRENGIEAIIHFAASVVVPGFGARPARLLSQQYNEHPRPDRMRGEQRRAPFHLLLDRRRLRQSNRDSGEGRVTHAADLALWVVEADERDHAARRRPRARSALT